jgi:hypothetical protein
MTMAAWRADLAGRKDNALFPSRMTASGPSRR